MMSGQGPDFTIPGEPALLKSKATGLKQRATSYDTVAKSLERLSRGGWTGRASEKFTDRFDGEPQRWRDAAGGFRSGANALAAYAEALKAAQDEADRCCAEYNRGLALSDAAVNAYNQNVDTYNAAVADANANGTAVGMAQPVLNDTGRPIMERALTDFAAARSVLDEAAQTCATGLRNACEHAPQERGWIGNAWEMVKGAGEGIRPLVEPLAPLVPLVGAPYTLWKVNQKTPLGDMTVEEWGAQGEIKLEQARALGDALVHHPGSTLRELGKAALDWDTWKDNPGRAFGRLVPNMVLTVATLGVGAGASAGIKAAQAVQTGLTKLSKTLANGGRMAAATARVTGRAARVADSVVKLLDPIDPVTGQVFLDETDLSIPGVLDLDFKRTHWSNFTQGRCFGSSWSSTLDMRIDVDLDREEVAFLDADGSVLLYDLPQLGEASYPIAGFRRWRLERGEALDNDAEFPSVLMVTDPVTRRRWHFVGSWQGGTSLLLATITDAYGNIAMIRRDEMGMPYEVIHSGGTFIHLVCDGRRIQAMYVSSLDEMPQLVREYAYDKDGNLSGVTNASGQTQHFGYTEWGGLAWWQDRNGSRYDYVYDTERRCVNGTGPDGILSGSLRFDVENNRTVVFDAAGEHSVYEYDVEGNITAAIDPTDRVTRTEWHSPGRPSLRVDPGDVRTQWEYAEDGQVRSLTDPTGARQEWEYSDDGDLISYTDGTGAVWRFMRNHAGDATAVTDPIGATTTFVYDSHTGGLLQVTDPTGVTTRYEVDAGGLPVAVLAADGGQTRLRRDVLGRVVEVRDPLGGISRTEYDLDDNLLRTVDADGVEQRLSYDGEGNLVTVVDGLGQLTAYTYTRFDQVASITRPDGSVVRVDWDVMTRLRGVTDPLGRSWQMEYDAAGRLLARTDVNGRRVEFGLDDAGRLAGAVNASGQSETYGYDAAGRVVSVVGADGTETNFTYDAAGQVVATRTRAAGGQVMEHQISRDAGGRVLGETWNGRRVQLDRDLAGRLVGRATASGASTSYGYDKTSGALAVIEVPGQESVQISRDALGREVARDLGGGVVQVWSYTRAGRIEAHTLSRGPGAQVLAGQRLSWDKAGQLTQVEDQRRGRRVYRLDELGRITSVVDPAAGILEAVGYDAAGTVTQHTPPGAAPGLPREMAGTLVKRVGRWRYEHDEDGRVVRRTHATLDGQRRTWSYEWDAQDQLVAVTGPDGVRTTYLYDGLGRRVEQHSGDDVRWWTWNGPTIIEQGDIGLGAQVWEVHPESGEVLGRRELNSADQRWFDAQFFRIVTDLVGQPSEVIGLDGAVVSVPGRSVWGPDRVLADVGPDLSGGLGFEGQLWDPATGWFYNLFRHYDPVIAGYTSPDPIDLMGGYNPTSYVPNPTTWTDPWGLVPSEYGKKGKKRKTPSPNDSPSPQVMKELQRIKAGRGRRRRSPSGGFDVFTGRSSMPRSHYNWIGSQIYDVPGDPMNESRILRNPRGEFGFTMNHYQSIRGFPEPDADD